MSKVKYFKTECEWKWQHYNHEDKLHMKSNDNEKYVCEKDKTHVRQKALKYACKQRQLSQ